MIVCQDTGQEFAISESPQPPTHVNEKQQQTLLDLAKKQLDSMNLNTNEPEKDNNENAEEIGEQNISTEQDTRDVKATENESTDQGISSMMSSGTISSDTVVNESESNTLTPTPQTEATSPLPHTTDIKEEVNFENSVQSSTPKHAYNTDTSSLNDTFSKTKDLHLDLDTGCQKNNEPLTKITERLPQTFDNSKDSGISDMTRSHSTVDGNSDVCHSIADGSSDVCHSIAEENGDLNQDNADGHPPLERESSRSSLSEEARKWLGKHSVSSGKCNYV